MFDKGVGLNIYIKIAKKSKWQSISLLRVLGLCFI